MPGFVEGLIPLEINIPHGEDVCIIHDRSLALASHGNVFKRHSILVVPELHRVIEALDGGVQHHRGPRPAAGEVNGGFSGILS